MGIIVPALQIIQPRLGIVVIPAVTEGVEYPNDSVLQRSVRRFHSNSKITPGIIVIRTNLITIGVVNGNNIALQILFKVEGVEDVGGIAFGSVLHPDWRTAFVIDVDQQVIAPSLADDLGAVQSVDVVGSVHDLVGTNAVGVFKRDCPPLRLICLS